MSRNSRGGKRISGFSYVVTRPQRKKCWKTGKDRHDRFSALTELTNCQRKGREEKRIYQCEFCCDWHLTQQEKRGETA